MSDIQKATEDIVKSQCPSQLSSKSANALADLKIGCYRSDNATIAGIECVNSITFNIKDGRCPTGPSAWWERKQVPGTSPAVNLYCYIVCSEMQINFIDFSGSAALSGNTSFTLSLATVLLLFMMFYRHH